jgi:hypothetical protein
VFIAKRKKYESNEIMPPILGPGGASTFGLFAEMGPFSLTKDSSGKLQLNDRATSWNKKYGMLFIDNPVGAGFSYTSKNGYCKDTKECVARNLYSLLTQFYTVFPEQQKNQLWITGESYAGVYVPTLAYSIVEAKKAGACDINLIGIAVGNGCTGNEVGVCSPHGDEILLPYLHAHGLFSTAAMNDITKECKTLAPGPKSSACTAAIHTATDEVGHVSIYDIYGPCDKSPQGKYPPAVEAGAHPLRAPVFGMVANRIVANGVGGPDACIDSFAGGAWINRDVTRKALHLHTPPDASGNWSTCGNNM